MTLLEHLLGSAFLESLTVLVRQLVNIGVYLLTPAVIVYFLNAAVRLANDSEGRSYPYHLWRVGGIALALITYPIWTIWLGKLFVLFSKAVYNPAQDNIAKEYLYLLWRGEKLPELSWQPWHFFSLETLSSLVYFLVWGVFELFSAAQVLVQMALWALGPLALVLSLLPVLQDSFRRWISAFCAVNLWSVLIAMLFQLVRLFVQAGLVQTAPGEGSKGLLHGVLLGILVMLALFKIPRLSGLLIGAGSAAQLSGGVMSLATGLVTGTLYSFDRSGGRKPPSDQQGSGKGTEPAAGQQKNSGSSAVTASPPWGGEGSSTRNNDLNRLE